MIAKRYSRRSRSDSRVFREISASSVSALKRGSAAALNKDRKYCCGDV
jgi:hypothetical protein